MLTARFEPKGVMPVIRVSEMNRSVEFYSGVLGLAVLFFLLARCGNPAPLVVALCSAFQGGLVMLWARTVGIEPSLAGRFELTPPMIVAGFIAGAVAALSAAAIARRRAARTVPE